MLSFICVSMRRANRWFCSPPPSVPADGGFVFTNILYLRKTHITTTQHVDKYKIFRHVISLRVLFPIHLNKIHNKARKHMNLKYTFHHPRLSWLYLTVPSMYSFSPFHPYPIHNKKSLYRLRLPIRSITNKSHAWTVSLIQAWLSIILLFTCY